MSDIVTRSSGTIDDPVRPRSGAIVRTVLALVAGAVLAVVWARFLPAELPASTDIVGYPIHSMFNVGKYFRIYEAILIVFPAASLAAFAALGMSRRFPRGGGVAARTMDPTPSEGVARGISREPGFISRVVRLLLVGVVIGIAFAYLAGVGSWILILLVAGMYAALAALLAAVLPLIRGSAAAGRAAWINALIAPAGVVALYAASLRSRVTVGTEGHVDRFPWLPAWLTIAVGASLLAWVVFRLRRAGPETEALQDVERDVLTFVTGPILLFLMIAYLPSALGTMDTFHEGESLAAGRLVRSGLFPWRDLSSVHGPLQDVLTTVPGTILFEDSRWGVAAGGTVLIRPAFVVLLYLLHARLLRADWLFLIMTPAIAIVDPRFLLLSPSLLVLTRALRRAHAGWALGLGSILVVQSILTPEAAPFAVAAGLAVLGFDLYHRQRGERIRVSMKRTVWLLVGAMTSVGVWAVYLVSNGAWDEFVGHYLTFGRGHELTGGIPIEWGTPLFAFAVVAPGAATLAFGLYFVGRWRSRRIRAAEWALAALSLYLIFYYRKFLSRADDHVFKVLAVAIPLLVFMVHRATTSLERMAASSRAAPVRMLGRLRLISVTLAGTLLLLSPYDVMATLRGLPTHFDAVAQSSPREPSLGYATDDAVDLQAIKDLRAALHELPNPSGVIFDFSNQPAIMHYLLDNEPASSYYHISMAIRRSTQLEVISDLKRVRPGVVAYHGVTGLASWDGVPNPVRHYDVSAYILDSYRPVGIVGGTLLMLRNDLEVPMGWRERFDAAKALSQKDLYFHNVPCDWGFVPNFLEVTDPPVERGAIDLSFRPTRGGVEFVIPADASRFDWLEISARSRVKADRFHLADRHDDVLRGILFRNKKGGGPRYLLRVGVCPQWRGYPQGSLVLLHHRPQDIVGIRLLRSTSEEGLR